MKKFNELNDQEKYECVNLFYDFLLRSITYLGSPLAAMVIEDLPINEKKIIKETQALMARDMAQFVKRMLERYQFSNGDIDTKVFKKIIEVEKRCTEFIDSKER